MTVVRRIARPMLASIFVIGGLDALRRPSTKVPAAEPVVHKVAGPLGLPDDPELLVRANAATMVLGGGMLALGRFPRLSAVALAASLLPTTLAGHRFWEEKDPEVRAQQKTAFFKNLSMLGGVLIAAVDTEGRPSLGYRARQARGHAGRSARSTGRGARRAARTARLEARLKAAQAHDALT